MPKQPSIDFSAVASFERARNGAPRAARTRTFALVLMAVFFIVLMLGLVAGVTLYRDVAASQDRAAAVQLQAGLLSNTVRANDAAASVQQGDGPEGPALVLVESQPTGSYETRIYLYRGHVVQEYAIAGHAYDPSGANELVESQTFSFSLRDGELALTTDAGTARVALRCLQQPEGGGR